jgi:hypothetical protein
MRDYINSELLSPSNVLWIRFPAIKRRKLQFVHSSKKKEISPGRARGLHEVEKEQVTLTV